MDMYKQHRVGGRRGRDRQRGGRSVGAAAAVGQQPRLPASQEGQVRHGGLQRSLQRTLIDAGGVPHRTPDGLRVAAVAPQLSGHQRAAAC